MADMDKIYKLYSDFMRTQVVGTPTDIAIKEAIEYAFAKGVEHGKEQEKEVR